MTKRATWKISEVLDEKTSEGLARLKSKLQSKSASKKQLAEQKSNA